MADPIGVASDADLLSRFAAVVGAGGLISGPEAAPYYTDVFRAGSTPLAILRPDSVPDLQMVVRIAAAAGLAIFPRGGGASYTDGFLPNTQHSIVIDTGRLNQILQINETDATVTVEAGVTWASLKAALDPLGLRTPFFGPFSGLAASVGGAMAQHSVTHGSGAHGISAQSAVAMDVVLATGELLRTDARQAGAAPFTRYYGPDLTGLFTGDCGALGIKARITLPLLRRKPDFDGLSVAFADFAGLAAAIRALALERLDDEHFAIDAALSQGQIARQDARSMLAAARSVFRSSSNPFTALRRLARMAVAGTERLANSAYTLHVIIDGANRGEVRAKCRRLRELFSGGQEIPNTVPVLVRGMPFAPLFNTLGPAGERWVPVHGILPRFTRRCRLCTKVSPSILAGLASGRAGCLPPWAQPACSTRSRCTGRARRRRITTRPYPRPIWRLCRATRTIRRSRISWTASSARLSICSKNLARRISRSAGCTRTNQHCNSRRWRSSIP